MKGHSRALALTLPSAATLLWLGAGAAHAQYGGGQGMMPGMPAPSRPGMGEESKEEGPAEAAPEEESKPNELEPLGQPTDRRRRTQVFELDGYLRLRADFLHKLFLGQGYQQLGDGTIAKPPFPIPLECGSPENGGASYAGGRGTTSGCGTNNSGSGNLRLRLEPTVNVTENVRVMAQIDVLDNTIAGSTPDSLASATQFGGTTARAPLSSLYTTQDPPEVGRNGWISSVRAKRAWGEVDSSFGSLRFGRMPWHFGRGIAFNNGACADCEGGTTVDRIMGITTLYGHQLMLSWDFGSQGYTFGMTTYGQRDQNSPPVDLSQDDDVYQLTGAILRMDDPQTWSEKIGRGDVAVNYGFQLVYREQSNEITGLRNGNTLTCNDIRADATSCPNTTGTAAPATGPFSPEDLANALGKGSEAVGARVFLPDLWFKLGWRALTVELEASGVFGRLKNGGPLVDPLSPNKRLTLAQLGWVLASDLALYHKTFFIGLETGGATGDQAENRTDYLNYAWKNPVRQPNGDTRISDFHFSPEYHVDEILFRRILGTVSNAVYVKPQLAYWLGLREPRQLGVTAAAIYSLAQVPVSTPGNALTYGLELNLGITYRNPADGFYGGLIYGVLFPFGALNRTSGQSPTSLWPYSEDAETAQVLRLFMGIRF